MHTEITFIKFEMTNDTYGKKERLYFHTCNNNLKLQNCFGKYSQCFFRINKTMKELFSDVHHKTRHIGKRN